MKKNPIGWIEIPVSDMDRAISFYSSVFQISIQKIEMGPVTMGWLPNDGAAPGASGALMHYPDAYKASLTHGPVIYFNCDDVAQELSRIEAAGGKILQTKTLISEDMGYMALISDPEGNRIALHSDS